MDHIRNHRIIFNSMKMIIKLKWKSFFMGLGVFIGIAALTMTLTVGNGIEKKIMDNVNRFVNPRNIVIIADQIEVEGIRSGESGQNTKLKMSDAEAIADKVEGIVIYDYMYFIQKEVSYSGRNYFTNIKGCRIEGEKIWNKPVETGRFFNQTELNSSKRVAVIGPKLAKKLFMDENPLGKQFRIANIPFDIIGVARAQGADPHGNDLDEEIYIPLTTMMRRVANVDFVNGIKFEFENSALSTAAIPEVRSVLRSIHDLTEGEKDDFTLITPVFVKEFVAKIVRVFKVLMPAVSVIVLLAAAIVVMALMNMTVKQRTREIGIRKALGATNKDINMQFMTENLIIVLSGGIAGIVVGLGLSWIFSTKLNAVFYIPVDALLIGSGLSFVVGLFTGIIPAKKAARMHPVEAIK